MMIGRKERGQEERGREGRKKGREGYKCGVIGVLQTHKLRLIGTFSPFYWTIELSTGYPQAVKNPCKIYHNPYYDILCNHLVTNTPGQVTDCYFLFPLCNRCSYPNKQPPNKTLHLPKTFHHLSTFLHTSLPIPPHHLLTHSFPHPFYPLIPFPNFLKIYKTFTIILLTFHKNHAIV